MTKDDEGNGAPTAKQRRGRRIAMSGDELDELLTAERVCRMASMSPDGRLHNTPLWFVWHADALWVSSVVRSQRWTDLQRNPAVSVVVDAGTDYSELRGAELTGDVAVVGEVPRGGERSPRLAAVEQAYGEKYSPTGVMEHDGRHAWLKLAPDKIVSWDFRKLPSA